VNKDKFFFFLKQQRKEGSVGFFFHRFEYPISVVKGQISLRRPN